MKSWKLTHSTVRIRLPGEPVVWYFMLFWQSATVPKLPAVCRSSHIGAITRSPVVVNDVFPKPYGVVPTVPVFAIKLMNPLVDIWKEFICTPSYTKLNPMGRKVEMLSSDMFAVFRKKAGAVPVPEMEEYVMPVVRLGV